MDSPQKRKASPELITNPFIKKRNREWRISPPPLSHPERRHAREREQHRELLEGRQAETTSSKDSNDAQGPLNTPDADAAAVSGLHRPISPPPTTTTTTAATSALVESTPLPIDNHLAYFTTLLRDRTLHPYPPATPRLPIAAYAALYTRAHARPTGAHFVVTQHDHPVAGPHYDLRLQINPTSSCSWALMYGLPGDPNARGRGRGRRTGSGALRTAAETRVHCLWNHLVETAGRDTGSLMVWDTGEYEVLAPRGRGRAAGGPSSSSSSTSDSEESPPAEDRGGWAAGLTQQQKLARAFASRKIRLRLRGTRLPRRYVVSLRLTRDEDAAGRAKAAAAAASSGKKPRGRRRLQAKPTPNKTTGPDTSDSDAGVEEVGEVEVEEGENDGTAGQSAGAGLSEMEKELRELEDAEVRRMNAYVGAVNTIGSVYQRKWFLGLEREACGFVRGKKDGRVWWERKGEQEEEEKEATGGAEENRLEWPFYVRGPECERSVVTGRLGRDVLRDEGVVGYVGRKGWRPILS